MNTGKHIHTGGKKEKKITHKKPRNPNRLKSVGSLALCILLPDGGLCSTTGAEPEALSVPFSSRGGVLSCTLLPAGNRTAMKAGRDLRCAHSSP